MTNDELDLTKPEKEVLKILAGEYRVNIHLLREETTLDEESITAALDSLTSANLVHKVTTGLYEYEEQNKESRGIPEIPNRDTQTAPIEPNDSSSTDEEQ